MGDVPENLASVGAQEVPAIITEQEVVVDRKQKITDEDIHQKSQSDLGEEGLSQAFNGQVEDDGDEGEDGRYQDGGGVDDTRQLSLISLLWSFRIITNDVAGKKFLREEVGIQRTKFPIGIRGYFFSSISNLQSPASLVYSGIDGAKEILNDNFNCCLSIALELWSSTQLHLMFFPRGPLRNKWRDISFILCAPNLGQ